MGEFCLYYIENKYTQASSIKYLCHALPAIPLLRGEQSHKHFILALKGPNISMQGAALHNLLPGLGLLTSYGSIVQMGGMGTESGCGPECKILNIRLKGLYLNKI
jgi:hypothetical protein